MRRRQKGFTLVEIVLTVGIVGAIVGTLGMAITSLLMNSGRTTSQNPVLDSAQNCGYWISRDVQMARELTLGSPNGFPLTIDIPVDEDPDHDYSIDYVFDGDRLKRQQYDSLGGLTSETLIARYVDTNSTTFSSLGGNLYKLTVRASMGEDAVTLNYEVTQRLSFD